MKRNMDTGMDTLTCTSAACAWNKSPKKRNRTKTNFQYGGEETQNADDQDAETRE